MIDLSSDTATRPGDAMRAAIAAAPVGDDQRGEDPTVNALQVRGADLLAKDAALFLPSATMANQIALKLHTRPGDEILCAENSHIQRYEAGGPAVHAGCLLRVLPTTNGRFTPEQVEAALNPDWPHCPQPRLISVENTHNFAGGTVWHPDELVGLVHVARQHNLALHLDGARLLNASAALGRSAAELAAPFDTVTLCLSKGLGAPAGALLLGTAETIAAARRYKHLFGGAMRQAGILAAGGLYALEHHVGRLLTDNENAQTLAAGLAAIPGVRLDPWPETNIVYFDVAGAGLTGPEAMAKLEAGGVRASGLGGSRLRFVTHLDISAEQIAAALEICRRALAP